MRNDTTHEKIKILLVDDDLEFCENLINAFKRKYDLEIVHTSDDANKKISKNIYEVLLLDLFISTNPPEEKPDGFGLIKIIKRKNLKSIIIAVTIDESQEIPAYRENVDYFFDKKTSSFQFLATIIDGNVAKKNAQIANIFLSHSSRDKTFVKLINRELQKNGLSTWLDEVNIKPGASISKKIMEAIDGSRYLLIFLSKNSMNSNWVQEELDTAIWKEIDEQSLTIVPIICEPFDEKLPSHLRKKLAVNFSMVNEEMEITFSEILFNESKKLKNLKENFEEKMQKLLKTFD